MSREQLTAAALALPPKERMELAQTLWASVHEPEDEHSEVDKETLAMLRRRAAELESGEVVGRPRDEVMAAARRAIGCE